MTLTHDLADTPATCLFVTGAGTVEPAGDGAGRFRILSDLETVLKTGTSLAT